MSMELLGVVWKASFKSTTEKIIVLALANYADSGGYCYPSQYVIAERTQLSRQTVNRTLSELEAKGVLVKAKKFKKNKAYTLNLEFLSQNAQKETFDPPEVSSSVTHSEGSHVAEGDMRMRLMSQRATYNVAEGDMYNNHQLHVKEKYTPQCLANRETSSKPLKRQKKKTPPKKIAAPPPADPATNGKASLLEDRARKVIEHLNEKADRRFNAEVHSKKVVRLLKRKDVDFKEVLKMVDRMCAKWKADEKMCEYLRPATLFGPETFWKYYEARDLPVTFQSKPLWMVFRDEEKEFETLSNRFQCAQDAEEDPAGWNRLQALKAKLGK